MKKITAIGKIYICFPGCNLTLYSDALHTYSTYIHTVHLCRRKNAKKSEVTAKKCTPLSILKSVSVLARQRHLYI